MKPRSIQLSVAALLLLAAQAPALAASGKTIRPAVGKPLQEAQKALQAKNYAEAKADIAKAEGAGKLTPYESYIIERLKASAAIRSGDYKSALAAYDKVVVSPELPAEEKLGVLDSYVKLAYTAKDYIRAATAVRQYEAAGGNNAQTIGLYAQSLYLAGLYKEAAAEVSHNIATEEQAGKRPSDTELQLLANCALKQNNMAAYTLALQKIVTYNPKPDYWLDLILRTAGQPGFSNTLDVDVYRLRKATGTMKKASDYMEAAQLALQAGFPNEAQGYVSEGYQKKLLGVGADATRHQRLKALVAKKLADDKATLSEGEKAALAHGSADALVNTGFNLVTYGQADRGLPLMLQGIKKGGLKYPDQAKLHLGYAYLLAGQNAAALKTFSSIRGSDGSQQLGNLWLIKTQSAVRRTAG